MQWFYECGTIDSIVIPKSVVNISTQNSFGGGTKVLNIYYKGTEEEWNSISGSTQPVLQNATIHYNYEG
jgi:hypothetical protein